MLDMGFQKDIEKIQEYMPNAQKMIFSATMPKYIQDIAKNYMENPTMIDLVGDDNTQIPPTIINELIFIEDDNQARDKVILQILEANKDKKILVFFDTKRDV